MTNLINDIREMHRKYDVDGWVARHEAEPDMESLKKLLAFRVSMLEEEFNETKDALAAEDPEEIVDGLIDIIVIALGTLDIYNVDTARAWDQVHSANMDKQVGQKPSRPNPLKLPDMIKPEGWIGPDHSNNHGLLEEMYENHS